MKKFLLSLLAFVLISTLVFAASGTKQYGNYYFMDGDVGIGMDDPSTKLEVDGTVTATGFAGPLTGEVTGNAGTATTLATTRAIYGNNFNGSAALTQVIGSAYGGTGNGFTKFTGPATAEKTFTLPNSSATLLYSGGDAGTPSALVGTNISGTAASFNIGGNAATVSNFTPASGSLTLAGADAVTITTTAATNSTLPLGTNTLAANDQTFYIGTTQVAINRASAALTLAGITLTTADIGTPSAGTLTNATGLPLTGLVDDTTTALGVGTLELGHATDTTLARSAAGVLSVEGVVIPSISSTNTLTNKRITKRVVTTTDDATAVIDVDVTDVYELTAIANATVFTLTGTPTDGQNLIVRYKDAGTTKGLTWTGFTALGIDLPTDTTAGKWEYVGVQYNSGASAWHAIATSLQE